MTEPITAGITIAGHQTLASLKHDPNDEHSGPFLDMKPEWPSRAFWGYGAHTKEFNTDEIYLKHVLDCTP